MAYFAYIVFPLKPFGYILTQETKIFESCAILWSIHELKTIMEGLGRDILLHIFSYCNDKAFPPIMLTCKMFSKLVTPFYAWNLIKDIVMITKAENMMGTTMQLRQLFHKNIIIYPTLRILNMTGVKLKDMFETELSCEVETSDGSSLCRFLEQLSKPPPHLYELQKTVPIHFCPTWSDKKICLNMDNNSGKKQFLSSFEFYDAEYKIPFHLTNVTNGKKQFQVGDKVVAEIAICGYISSFKMTTRDLKLHMIVHHLQKL